MTLNNKSKSIIDRLYMMLYGANGSKIAFALLLASLFMFGIRYGFGLYDDVQRIFGIIALFTLYYAFSPRSSINFGDISFWLLLFSFFLMAVFKYMNYPIMSPEYDETSYAWVLPVIYILAKLIVSDCNKGIENRVFMVLVMVATGLFIQGLFTYYGMGHGCGISETWSHPFWNSLQDGTRNTWDVTFAMTWGALFYAFIKRKERKWFFISVILGNIISLIISIPVLP